MTNILSVLTCLCIILSLKSVLFWTGECALQKENALGSSISPDLSKPTSNPLLPSELDVSISEKTPKFGFYCQLSELSSTNVKKIGCSDAKTCKHGAEVEHCDSENTCICSVCKADGLSEPIWANCSSEISAKAQLITTNSPSKMSSQIFTRSFTEKQTEISSDLELNSSYTTESSFSASSSTTSNKFSTVRVLSPSPTSATNHSKLTHSSRPIILNVETAGTSDFQGNDTESIEAGMTVEPFKADMNQSERGFNGTLSTPTTTTTSTTTKMVVDSFPKVGKTKAKAEERKTNNRNIVETPIVVGVILIILMLGLIIFTFCRIVSLRGKSSKAPDTPTGEELETYVEESQKLTKQKEETV